MNKTQLWKIEYWHNTSDQSSIEKWFDSLSKEEFKSIAKELTLLGLCGNSLKLPHSRCLKNGLFELRERKYGYRLYYAFLPARVVVLLHSGNKNSQERDIIIARGRLNKLNRDLEESFYENKKLSPVS